MNNIELIISEIKKVVKGKDDVIKKVLMAVICKGHVLLEDIPGVGKTTMALCFSRVMSLNYKRVQFTPDVLPSDITGYYMYNMKSQEFDFKEGAAMCNLLLADEINRTSPKTQSALLEVMEEGKVTVDGVTRKLPSPFIVIATQNPFGSSGTQKLPQSQLDRFVIQISIGYPDVESEIEILKGDSKVSINAVNKVLNVDELIEIQNKAEQIYVDQKIFAYITELANVTRNHEYFRLGISPRGSRALLRMSKASAFINGRDYVVPEDVIDVFFDVSAHRVEISPKAKANGFDERGTLNEVLKIVKMPKIK